MTHFLENWFLPAFIVGMGILLIGQVLMVVYRRPDVTSLQILFTGLSDKRYPQFLKSRLELVRDDKVRLVNGLMLSGAAIVAVGVLVLAGFAIARSIGAI